MSLRIILKKVDEQSGRKLSSILRGWKEVKAHQRAMLRFQIDRLRRRWKYKGLKLEVCERKVVAERLSRDGFTILPQAVDENLLLSVRDEMERCIHSGICLDPISKDSARPTGDLEGSKIFLTSDELGRGEEYFRQHTNNVQIHNPLLNCPSVVNLAFHDLPIEIAACYLGCVPAIGGLNLRKSYANELPEFDTNYFHSDKNSPKFLKCFFYLNDVDNNGGPFCYVRGSHRRKFSGWREKSRWTYQEIAAIYGEDNIVNLTAELGDLIVADTAGFHRGIKVRTKDRVMLTVNYVIHPEFGGRQKPFELSGKDYERLSTKQKAVADFLEVTNNF